MNSPSSDVPEVLYEVGSAITDTARINPYLAWLRTERDLTFDSYAALHAWSIEDLPAFWQSVWEFFQVKASSPPLTVLESAEMPGARWFPGATLNYAEHAFGRPEDAQSIAVIGVSQTREEITLTFGELADEVRRARAGFRRLGVGRGDRVVGYVPNIPETLIAFLACASLGATWAACAPEFGAQSVIDRFQQVEPTVLIAIGGYTYGDKVIDKLADVEELRAALPSLHHVVHVDYGDRVIKDSVPWREVIADTDEVLEFEPVPFDHPLYVLFSSGTTGKPKAIVHRHGGILLEHLKNHAFHWDLGEGDRVLWFTTTAWMLWNKLVSALLVRASVVLVDGNPMYPDLAYQWRLAERTGATLMGASPGYVMSCRKEGMRPAVEYDLSALRQLGVAGSPFSAEGFRWVFDQFGDSVLLNVGSGGTDVCTGLMQASPLLPVYVGEMSGLSLGVDAKSFDEDGNVVVGDLGELVITSPMPSMPVGFWGDDLGDRFRATYFEKYPGTFQFGDWCRFTEAGTCIITGRSDATLNRGGVRLGTAEFYRVLDDFAEASDGVVVHLEDADGGMGELLLFVVPAPGVAFDDDVVARLRRTIRTALSPRHVPDHIECVPAVPYNRTGKRLEVPVKKILLGADPGDVASSGVLADVTSLDPFVAFATRRQEAG